MVRIFAALIFICGVSLSGQVLPGHQKKQDVEPFIKQLKEFKDSWNKAKKEKGDSYKLISAIHTMLGKTETHIVISKGKAVSRKVTFNYQSLGPGKNPKDIEEKGENLNKSRSGTKAKTMDEYIAEAEKMLADYKADKIKGRLYFKAKGTTLMCLLTPHMVADHPGTGVRISSCYWKK